MRALITGAGGFVGGHLCAYLLAFTDWELMGTVYPQPVESQPPEPRLRLRHADLRDPEGVREEVRYLVDTFDRPEGGMMIAAGNGIVAGTPLQNIEAFLDEAVRYGAAHRRHW